jgi:hypothetical protein
MRTLYETRLIFTRAMRLSLRNPVWVILGLVQPSSTWSCSGRCWRT